MTTTAKPVIDSVANPPEESSVVAEPNGTIRLKLAPLGIDHQADDFPVRFIEFCEQNDLYNMEVNAQGELLILPMTGFRGNRHEYNLAGFLFNWQVANGGIGASQTSRFHLPSGDIRGPDAAWLTREHYDAQTSLQQETVIEGAPAFVVEVRSRTDDLPPLERKMALWMESGTLLGWLIDTRNRQVLIYRAGQDEPETLDDPEFLDGEEVLPGFAFPVRQYVFDLE